MSRRHLNIRKRCGHIEKYLDRAKIDHDMCITHGNHVKVTMRFKGRSRFVILPLTSKTVRFVHNSLGLVRRVLKELQHEA